MKTKLLTLEEVVAAALAGGMVEFQGDAQKLAELPTRFPVHVDQQTRVFLEYHALALGTSISALSGLILNQVVAHTLADQLNVEQVRQAEKKGSACQSTTE